MGQAPINSKRYTDTYLYNRSSDYEKNIVQFLMNADEIDKVNKNFEDIIYDVKKRQVTSILVDILKSDKIKLMYYKGMSLPRAFKVFAAKDIRGDQSMKVWIDCSECLYFSDGVWKASNIDKLICHLISAMNYAIYYSEPNRLTMNSELTKSGTEAFAMLVNDIINYLYKTNLIQAQKDTIIYLSSVYYQVNLLGKDLHSNSVQNLAKSISRFSDRQIELIEIYYDEHSFDNIKTFIDLISKVLKLNKLTLEVFIDKWIYRYAPGTQFALELFPAFAEMITNAYVSVGLNNGVTIEKVVETSMSVFTKSTFTIGQSVIQK